MAEQHSVPAYGAIARRDFSPERTVAHQLTCEIVGSMEAIQELSSEWDWLARADTVFQRFGWFRAFWDAYGSGLKIFTPVVRKHDGRVLGILPLFARDRVLVFPRGDYNDIICEESDTPAALLYTLRALLRFESYWDECVWENVPRHSRMARHLATLPGNVRRRLQVVFRYPCPTMIVSDDASGELRKLAHKKDIRRQQHRLERLGQLTFSHIDTGNDVLRHLPSFFKQHIERRALLGQRSRFLEPDARDFYQNLASEFDPRGPLRFSILQLADRPLAYHFGFEYGRTFLRLTSVFDVNYSQYSPGEVLLGKLLEYADDRGIREFDFGIGGEEYKRRFSNNVKDNLVIYLTRRSFSARHLQRRILEVARRVKEHIQQQVYASRHNSGVIHRVVRKLAHSAALISSVGVGRWIKQTVLRVVRSVFSRVDVALLVSSPDVRLSEAHIPGELAVATLGDLGLIALDHRDLLPHLHEFGERLNKGDVAYVYHPDRRTVLIAWVGERSTFEVPVSDPICQVQLQAPAAVLYDCWASSKNLEHKTWLIDAVVTQLADRDRRLWVVGNNKGYFSGTSRLPSGITLLLKHWCRRTTILGMPRVSSNASPV